MRVPLLSLLVLALPATAAPKLKAKPPAWPDVVIGADFPSAWSGPLRVAAIDKRNDRVDLRYVDDTPYLVTQYKPVGYPVFQRSPTRTEVQDMIDQSRKGRP